MFYNTVYLPYAFWGFATPSCEVGQTQQSNNTMTLGTSFPLGRGNAFTIVLLAPLGKMRREPRRKTAYLIQLLLIFPLHM
jgi:hypothetical protein